MRIVIVGRPADRARLRQELAEAPIEITGEADTLAEAQASDAEVDAFLVAAFDPATQADDANAAAAEPLTPRERDVLNLLAEGLPNKTIAARLGISDQTVKFPVAAICGKLGASNRTDAVRLAIRRGLIAI